MDRELYLGLEKTTVTINGGTMDLPVAEGTQSQVASAVNDAALADEVEFLQNVRAGHAAPWSYLMPAPQQNWAHDSAVQRRDKDPQNPELEAEVRRHAHMLGHPSGQSAS